MDPVFISCALNDQWWKLNNKCVLIYNTLIFSVPLSSTALLPHWYFQPILHLHSPAISGFPPGGFHTQVFKLSILYSREGGSRSHQEARRIPKQALQFPEASKGTTKGFSVSHSSRHQKQSLISVGFLHSNLQSKRDLTAVLSAHRMQGDHKGGNTTPFLSYQDHSIKPVC